MAAETGCVFHQQERLSTGSTDKDDWNDFDGFQGTQSSLVEDRLSKDCANARSSTGNSVVSILTGTEAGSLLNDALERCFCQSETASNSFSHSTPPQCLHSPESTQAPETRISNDRVWQRVIGNVHNVLPTDWSTTRARQLLQDSLGVSSDKVKNAQPAVDLDLSEDEELQQAFDMHSLIVSNVHQEPLFTAEQVIKEIEDMLEDSGSGEENEPTPDDTYSVELAKLRERSRARISTARESIESMTSSSLCELYDEMDSLVRELSEELVLELARRDELEYEKELKNQFISLLLSVQRRHRALVESKLRGGSSNAKGGDTAAACTGSAQPGSYLTTLIPYDPKTVPPNIEYLQIYVKILTAINEDSPTVPSLLTDYILNVICPKV